MKSNGKMSWSGRDSLRNACVPEDVGGREILFCRIRREPSTRTTSVPGMRAAAGRRKASDRFVLACPSLRPTVRCGARWPRRGFGYLHLEPIPLLRENGRARMALTLPRAQRSADMRRRFPRRRERVAVRRPARVRAQAPTVERCEMCSTELSGEHQHLIEPASAENGLRVRCLRDSFQRAKVSEIQTHAAPDPVSPGKFQMTECAMGRSDDSHRAGVFFQSASGARSMRFTQVPREPRSPCCPWRHGTKSKMRNTHLKEMEADVEALLVNRVGAVAACSPSITSCRSTNVTSWLG